MDWKGDKRYSGKVVGGWLVVGTLHEWSNFTVDTNERVKWFTEYRGREWERLGVKIKRVRSRDTEKEERKKSARAEEKKTEKPSNSLKWLG